MNISVSFFGPIRRPWPENTRELEVEASTSIEALLRSLGYEEDDLRRVAVVVNGRRKKKLDTELQQGDDVRCVLLAGGG